jgi:hypothetical protein
MITITAIYKNIAIVTWMEHTKSISVLRKWVSIEVVKFNVELRHLQGSLRVSLAAWTISVTRSIHFGSFGPGHTFGSFGSGEPKGPTTFPFCLDRADPEAWWLSVYAGPLIYFLVFHQICQYMNKGDTKNEYRSNKLPLIRESCSLHEIVLNRRARGHMFHRD